MSQAVFGADSTVDEVIRGIDLNGKVAVVTGTSAGLGIETARALASAGATVLMAARDEAKNQKAMAAVKAAVPGAKIEHVTLDLGDLNSVRAAAAAIVAKYPALHILINNAGIMACPLMRTAQGFEMQFGTNHLGHFLFTCLLVPALKKGAPARIVSLSSGGHRTGVVDFEDPQFERRPYNSWVAYGQAKTANALFAVGLTRRLQKFGITANAVHPGSIATELSRHLTEADLAQLAEWAKAGAAVRYKTPAQGAATQVWAAVSPALNGVSGKYLEDCGIGEVDTTPMSMTGYMPHALDAEAAERLWVLSEQCVDQTFDFA